MSETNNDLSVKITFEESISIIDEELLKRRGKWRLDFIAWMNFDDVCQKIRLHIFKKWDHWDQSRPLRPWLNRLICNQIANLIRNNYSSFAKPCLTCPHNMGADICALHGIQSSACSDYSKWEKVKKAAKEIKMACSLNSAFSYGDGDDKGRELDIKEVNTFVDYDSKISDINNKMKSVLTALEWKIYDYIYIQNLSDVETARLMGYKTSEKNRSPGYKQIKKVKNKIYEVAKKIIYEL